MSEDTAAINDDKRPSALGSISAVIISCDEADVIEECLMSVASWVDEIVIVDMHSTDSTRDIASRYGARILSHVRLDYVEPARDFSLKQARSEWILILDPDERVSDNLAVALQQVIHNASFDVLFLPYRNLAFGTLLNAPAFAEVPHPRLMRASIAAWPPEVHGIPQFHGLRCQLLRTDLEDAVIYHNTWRTIAQVLDKNRRYAPSDAVNLRAKGLRFSLSNLLLTPLYVFVNQFFRGQGYQDGVTGLLKVALLAMYHFTVYAELWELEKRPPIFDRRVARWGGILAQPYRIFTPIEDLIINVRKKRLQKSIPPLSKHE